MIGALNLSRSTRITSRPVISGMRISSKIRSGRCCSAPFERLFTTTGGNHAKPLLRKFQLDELQDTGLVIHGKHQWLYGHGSSSSTGSLKPISTSPSPGCAPRGRPRESHLLNHSTSRQCDNSAITLIIDRHLQGVSGRHDRDLD